MRITIAASDGNEQINGVSYPTFSSYVSPNSFISGDVIYSRHWQDHKKMFVVFLNHYGKITLRAGESVASIRRANGFFEEEGEDLASKSFFIHASSGITTVRLNEDVVIDSEQKNGDGQYDMLEKLGYKPSLDGIKGNPYVITLSEN